VVPQQVAASEHSAVAEEQPPAQASALVKAAALVAEVQQLAAALAVAAQQLVAQLVHKYGLKTYLAAIEERYLQQLLAMMTATTPTLYAPYLAKATNLNWPSLLSYPFFFFFFFFFF